MQACGDTRPQRSARQPAAAVPPAVRARTVSTMLVKWKAESVLSTPLQRGCSRSRRGRLLFLPALLLGARTMTGARFAGTAPDRAMVVPVHAAVGEACSSTDARARSAAGAARRAMAVLAAAEAARRHRQQATAPRGGNN